VDPRKFVPPHISKAEVESALGRKDTTLADAKEYAARRFASQDDAPAEHDCT
jgi:hypothetical protein